MPPLLIVQALQAWTMTNKLTSPLKRDLDDPTRRTSAVAMNGDNKIEADLDWRTVSDNGKLQQGRAVKPRGGRLLAAAPAAVAALLALGAAGRALADTGELPNIVFILGDDLGIGDVGLTKSPSSPIPTPNIDALARQGMTFTNANTSSSVCAPSRYSAVTGNYTFRGRDKWGIWIYNYASDFLAGQKTVGDMLRAAGYETAYVGKTHFGGDFYQKNSNQFYRGNDASQVDFTRQFQNGVLAHGFDYSYVLPNGVQNEPYAFFENDKFLPINPNQPTMVLLPAGQKGNSIVQTAGYGDANWDSSLAGPRLLAKAVGFIDRHYTQYGTSKPFFLYLSTEAIHEPNTPPTSFDGFPVKGVTGIDAKADMIYEFDLEVGEIVSALQQRGLANNTLIIVTSDNGGTDEPKQLALGHDSVGGLRGHKTLIYQGGYRVPFVAKWGDGTPAGSHIKPGTRTSQLVMQQDWVSAIYHLTAQAIPATQALDSANILPVLLGTQPDGVPVRDEMVIQAAHWGDQTKFRGIQMGDWVLIFNAAATPIELYDVTTDPTQKTNRIDDPAQAARVTSMAARFDYVVNHSTRTVPVEGGPSPCGQPGVNAKTDRAAFLWKDCTANYWHLQFSAGGSYAAFTGTLTSTAPFSDVTGIGLEPADKLDYTTNPKVISFSMKLASYADEFDFAFQDGASVCLSMSKPANASMLLGAGRAPIRLPFNLKTLGPC